MRLVSNAPSGRTTLCGTLGLWGFRWGLARAWDLHLLGPWGLGPGPRIWDWDLLAPSCSGLNVHGQGLGLRVQDRFEGSFGFLRTCVCT